MILHVSISHSHSSWDASSLIMKFLVTLIKTLSRNGLIEFNWATISSKKFQHSASARKSSDLLNFRNSLKWWTPLAFNYCHESCRSATFWNFMSLRISSWEVLNFNWDEGFCAMNYWDLRLFWRIFDWFIVIFC